jgi:tRNA A37 threonylcarbamoyladenosine synthetase subunit TsaC/SUA5/YrdC
LNEAWEIRERLQHEVDLVIDGGACGLTPTTVVDLTGATPVILRPGKGPVDDFKSPA